MNITQTAIDQDDQDSQDDEVQGYSDGSVALGGLLSFSVGGVFGLVTYTSYMVTKDAIK
jgi:hypothetical protein